MSQWVVNWEKLSNACSFRFFLVSSISEDKDVPFLQISREGTLSHEGLMICFSEEREGLRVLPAPAVSQNPSALKYSICQGLRFGG